MTEPELAPFPYPELTPSLEQQARLHQALSIHELFQVEPNRIEQFSAQAAGWHFDYSRSLLNQQTRETLLALASAAGLTESRHALFDGGQLNHTEGRAALHTLLRCKSTTAELSQKLAAVRDCRAKMAAWVDAVHNGEHRGHSGQQITDVVNLGIGGSDLGPRLVVEALRPFHKPATRVHFCANIDPSELSTVLAGLDPARTLFIICSKTLRTEETLHNALSAKRWLLASGAPEAAIESHFLAVSTNLQAAREFGIPADNILPLWEWVGGRYSLWSAIGWSIAFAVGNDAFAELLSGAAEMDEHFRKELPERNMPMLMSLLEVWYVNFLQARVTAVIPYDHNLKRLPLFLQQLSMESNGKRVNHKGQGLGYSTAPILWGDEGSNGQHSFHQLLHQGTLLCPIDFILPLKATRTDDPDGHDRLVANCLSQAQALLLGRNEIAATQSLSARGMPDEQVAQLAPHLVIPGNRPSTTLSCAQLDPARLGSLLALYEHKVFCSGQIWQINSFDQWGVELGKELGARIYQDMQDGNETQSDPSTTAQLMRWRNER
jgi:glucose-6-phosphate isomerase